MYHFAAIWKVYMAANRDGYLCHNLESIYGDPIEMVIYATNYKVYTAANYDVLLITVIVMY